MKPNLVFSILSGALLLLSGCASSSYHFVSEPPDASVYYFDPATQKRFLMGTTPLTYKKSSVPKDKPFLVTVEKEGYAPVETPVAPTDGTQTFLNFKLKPDANGLKRSDLELNQTIKNLFVAQKLIFAKRYQASVVELDKLLKERPNLVQALIMKGTAYYLLQDMNSAIASWKKALELDRDNEELNSFLQEKNIRI